MNINYQKELNNKQLEAVTSTDGALLIIAGAGSGKTKTITLRIAYMLEQGIRQNEILALTFTNKAAGEMTERIRSAIGKKLYNLTVSTFHSFGVKILRENIHHLGYKPNFSIYDQADQISMIKDVASYLNYSKDTIDGYQLAALFSDIKTGRGKWTRQNDQYEELFKEYQEHLKAYNAVDFDDLIILPLTLLEKYPQVLEAYQKRFKYFMVDEFQDTSFIQYKLISILAKKSGNICVVGDDDQSIYSWRGANYENILNFEKEFKNVKEIKLEQNYRSTKTILTAANGVISNNSNRKAKKLWTGLEQGNDIEICYPDNEEEEGIFIADKIKSLKLRNKIPYHQFGVLVRTNSLTRTVETAFLANNVPYKVSGGKSFFQRKEIKDIIAYLRIIENPDDDVNFLRICNTPKRGIGKKTLGLLRDYADKKKYSLYSALSAFVYAADSPLSERLKSDLSDFMVLIENYRGEFSTGKTMASSLKSLIERIGYWGYLIQDSMNNEKVAKYKFSNIMTFVDILQSYESNPDNIDPTLYGFLTRITLITRDNDNELDDTSKVNLMTIHSAKGLEFRVVFIIGAEDGIIPHARSLEENAENIEEERRLFYVALTRAREKLFITSCRTRKHMREIIESMPSPFLLELPQELLCYQPGEDPVDKAEAGDFFAAIKSKFN